MIRTSYRYLFPVALLVCLANTVARAEESARLPCLGKICLGMGLNDVAKMDLTPATDYESMQFNPPHPTATGLDASGHAISFSVKQFDRPRILELQQKVKTLCSASASWSAYTKASDGLKIRLGLSPRMVEGKGQIVVSEISRVCPCIGTGTEKEVFVAQLRKQYADFYVPSGDMAIGKTRVYDNGDELVLEIGGAALASEKDLMEQPGCVKKLRLD